MKTENKKTGGKWLIASIGLLFVIYSVFLGTLTFFGKETSARITSYRQEYGERNETIRNQYTYLFGYEFVYEGKTYSGTGQRIGNAVYLKNDGHSFMTVKFLTFMPQFNTAYEEKGTLINMLIMLCIGVGLIYATKVWTND